MIKLIACLCIFSSAVFAQPERDISGAWKSSMDGHEAVLIFTGKFFSLTTYDFAKKNFIATRGGSWSMNEDFMMMWKDEFNTSTPDQIGKESAVVFMPAKIVGTMMIGDGIWSRVDDTTPGKLAGAWLITGRMVGDEMNNMTPGARRTMKILSGTRFQWIAYNTDTKEFLGTGGGTYTTENGKYVERIEFFSRDASRVGMKLSFEFSLDTKGLWSHKGLSSKGDPIDEVWTRREVLGL